MHKCSTLCKHSPKGALMWKYCKVSKSIIAVLQTRRGRTTYIRTYIRGSRTSRVSFSKTTAILLHIVPHTCKQLFPRHTEEHGKWLVTWPARAARPCTTVYSIINMHLTEISVISMPGLRHVHLPEAVVRTVFLRFGIIRTYVHVYICRR